MSNPVAATMSDRASKLAKVGKLRRTLPHMSQSALAAMLKTAKNEPLSDITTRAAVRLSRDVITNTRTPYGQVLQQVPLPKATGGVWMLDVASMWAVLYTVAKSSVNFAQLLVDTVSRIGPPRLDAPWRIAMYTDEVDPGDPVSRRHGRKVQACYWSILEFGAAALSNEDVWFVSCTAGSDMVH